MNYLECRWNRPIWGWVTFSSDWISSWKLLRPWVSAYWGQYDFLTFPACFLIPIFFSNLKSNCSNFLYLRNLQDQVKKAFHCQKLFWPFTVWKNCSSDIKIFENSRPSASNFKHFFRSLEQFFLTVGQNNFGNKIPFHIGSIHIWRLIINISSVVKFERWWPRILILE